MSRLHVVSTPIGNLEDITVRALRTLRECTRILAEDTRRTSILLRHHDVDSPLVSAHRDNEAARAEQVVGWLDAGEDIAIVTDAGTPLLSDPGARIVDAVIAAGHVVVPIPGPSALLAALVGSGLPADAFTFYGFPPRSGRARERLLGAIEAHAHTTVLYEAPGRLLRLLEDLGEACGEDRQVAVARELTKIYEEFFRGTLGEARRYYQDSPPRGEIVVLVAGRSDGAEAAERGEETARVLARALLDHGRRASSVARELSDRLDIARNDAYTIALDEAEKREEGEK